MYFNQAIAFILMYPSLVIGFITLCLTGFLAILGYYGYKYQTRNKLKAIFQILILKKDDHTFHIIISNSGEATAQNVCINMSDEISKYIITPDVSSGYRAGTIKPQEQIKMHASISYGVGLSHHAIVTWSDASSANNEDKLKFDLL